MLRRFGLFVVCLGLAVPSVVAQAPQRNEFGPGSAPGGGDFGPLPGGPSPHAMFDAIDSDGDGTINTRELRRAAITLKQLDSDNDGNLSRAEAMGGAAGDPVGMVDRLMQNDQNGDGKLTEDEVPRNIAQMLVGADTNGDGAIDRTELATAMENARNRFGGPGGRFGGGPAGFGIPGGDPRRSGPNLMQYDRNGDGQLSAGEVPRQLMGMLRGADQNGNGTLDAQEIQAASQRMNERVRGQRALPPGVRIGPQGIERSPPPQ